MQRFKTSESACPICGGYDRAQRGQGARCFGYLSSDGTFAHCTRSEHAGSLQPHIGKHGGETYAHRLEGPCKCGVTHREASAGQVRQISDSRRAQIVATYDYRDEHEKLVYQVLRKNPKGFSQRRPDGLGGWLWNLEGVQPLLYKLPQLLAAVSAGDTVYIAEGEKDVEALTAAGVAATCNSGGAGKFPAAMARHLRGADVVILRDKDDPGHKHARDVYAKIRNLAKSVRVVEARKGHDAHDHLSSGLRVNDFVQVWPEPDRATDLAGWKRSILATSFTVTEPIVEEDIDAVLAQPDPPRWPSGLLDMVRLLEFQGVTLISGSKGAGKSYLAIASSLAAAQAGWQVEYLSAEMSAKLVALRACAHLRGKKPPPTWSLKSIGYGATAQALCDLLCQRVTDRKMLVVFDSLSSFVDQGVIAAKGTDAFGMFDLKRALMWCVNVRRLTQGQISFLCLAELARAGGARGNFSEYKVDLALEMQSDKKQNLVKILSIEKGWAAPVGKIGRFTLDVRDASLRCNAPANEQEAPQ